MNDQQVQAHQTDELTDAQLDLVTGGSIFQALSNAISDVLKNMGSALQTAARAG